MNKSSEKSFGISKVGTHEAIHSNIFDEKLGAYPNAMATMLRGTSALGVPQGKNKYLGKIYDFHCSSSTGQPSSF